MYRFIRRLFRDLPDLPDTLEQDLQNPLQRDRLPDARNIEIDFPIFSGTQVENRQNARRWFLIAFGVACFVAILEFYFDRPVVTAALTRSASPKMSFFQLLLGFPVTVGFVMAWLSYLNVCKPIGHWLLKWIVTPHIVLAIILVNDPMLTWVVGAGVATLVADLFATHFLHLQTTAPMERQRALNLRQLWQRRFRLGQAIRGNEFYPFAFLLLVSVVAGFVVADWMAPPEYAVRNVFRFVGLGIGIFVIICFLEALAAFVYARAWLNPLTMVSCMQVAVVSWLTYDRNEVDAPGAYRSPAGTCKQRRWMAFGLVVLLASSITRFSSPARDLDLIDQGRHPIHGDSWGKSEPTEDTDTPGPQHEPRIANTEEDTEPASHLEAYQQRMLDRMPADEREAYLSRLTQQAVESTRNDNSNTSHSVPQDGTYGLSKFLPPLLAHVLVSTYMFIALLFIPFLTVASSLCLLLTFVFATTARLAARLETTSMVTPEDLLTAERWKELVARVQSSNDKTEKESLLLGVNKSDNTPVLVPRAVFAEHAHLLGDSGSGKTSIGIASILSQLIRCKECSVVVLDLKGDDLAMFEGVRCEAENAGIRFRWFTNQLNHSTYAFNPLRQQPLKKMTLYQKVDMLTTAMGLQYGRDYGRAYYSDANARMLHAALGQHGDVASFEELAGILNDVNSLQGIDRELRQAGAHLGATVNRLADAEAMNVVPNNGYPQSVVDASIEFTDVFREPQVVQFHLTSTIGTTSSAEMARIALYSLITAATAVPPKQRVQTFVVIDEFQRIIAGNIEMLLQLARSLNIGIILANQSLMDLKTASTDLIPAISANTRFRQIFAASNLEEQERISRGSGEALTYSQSWQEYVGAFSTALADGRTLSEQITPRLRMNDILLATDHPLQSIVQIRRGSGYAQYGGMPFVMRSTHQITYKEYIKRKDAQWPDASEETLVPKIRDDYGQPRGKAGWFGEHDVLVDEHQSSDSAGHYLDQLYQQQKAASNDTVGTEDHPPDKEGESQ